MDIACQKRGFTLIEILVVVLILGFILSLAMYQYLRARTRSAANVCNYNQKMIYTAASQYMFSNLPSLESIRDKRARLQALVDAGYLRNTHWLECPTSSDYDYDDYIMIFRDGFIHDIECEAMGNKHPWP